MSRYALKAALRLPYPPGRKPMSEPIVPAPSPTGEPKIPPAAIPWLQLAYPILVVLGAQFALPGPWTPERYFATATAIVGGLLGMGSPGNRWRQ